MNNLEKTGRNMIGKIKFIFKQIYSTIFNFISNYRDPCEYIDFVCKNIRCELLSDLIRDED